MSFSAVPLTGESSLRGEVQRAHRRMAVISVSLAALFLVLAGVVALRVYLVQNLDLMARSLAYTVEAAVVFNDRAEASDILARLVQTERVAQATVFDAKEQVFVQWQQTNHALRARVGEILGRWMWLPNATAPVLSDGSEVGRVVLRSDGQGLLQFLGTGALAVLVCLALAASVSMVLTRQLLRDIVTPLQHLARVARAARHDRALDQRVPPARIAELNSLGDDFNALLQELETRYVRLEHQNATLTHKAQHDSLTGLPNRDYLEGRMHTAIQEARANNGSMAVLFVDSDHLKEVNDQYGHSAGDRMLVTVAQRIRSQLRETDLVARIGGDEFAVLLAPLRGEADALRIADKILRAMEEPLVLETQEHLDPSVSIGISIFPAHGVTASELLRAADAAMYHAKSSARGTCQVARHHR